ncbi:heavy-metal-associated domain-containing protein [Helicobacter sp. 23-1044]
MRVELKVSGMHCKACVDKITRFVREVSGVGEVRVDLDVQIVRVDYESPATLEAIKEAILDSGFEVE